jgi:hypothetical protein
MNKRERAIDFELRVSIDGSVWKLQMIALDGLPITAEDALDVLYQHALDAHMPLDKPDVKKIIFN